MSQKENVEKLLELIRENPNAEILPMVDYETVAGDEYGYWAGSWGEASLDEYYNDGERIYFRSEDEQGLIDMAYDDQYGEDISDEEALKKAKEKVNAYAWTKCICVYIGPA